VSDLRASIVDLHSYGRSPEEIARKLSVNVETVVRMLMNLGLLKKARRKNPAAVPQERKYILRKLDADIMFHQGRANDLIRYRAELLGLEETGNNLRQNIQEASRNG
jgi:hypothetical protein